MRGSVVLGFENWSSLLLAEFLAADEKFPPKLCSIWLPDNQCGC